MIKLNEDFIEKIDDDEIISGSLENGEKDDVSRASLMKKAVGIYMSNEQPALLVSEKIFKFRELLDKLLKRLFNNNICIGDYVIGQWGYSDNEYDEIVSHSSDNGDVMHFYVFFNDQFKSSKNVIWFFNRFNEMFWHAFHTTIADTNDFYYNAQLYINENGTWEDTGHINEYGDGFECFMDRDYLVDGQDVFWKFYQILTKFCINELTFKALDSVCSCSSNIQDMLETTSKQASRPIRGSNVFHKIEEFFDTVKFQNLEKFIDNEDIHSPVRFWYVNADEQPTLIKPLKYKTASNIIDYIKDVLNGFDGLSIGTFIEVHDHGEQVFDFYMGCFFIDGLHRHITMSVLLDKDPDLVADSRQTFIDLFGTINPYFSRELS